MSELIHRAEHADTAAQRARPRREAASLATLLWRRRERLPGRAYPLAPFRRLLETLTVLRADERRRWWGASPEDREAAALFQDFGRLMPLLFFARVAVDEQRPHLAGAAYEALTAEEQALLSDVAAWMDACAPEAGEELPPAVRVVFVEESDTPPLDAAHPLAGVATPRPVEGEVEAVTGVGQSSGSDGRVPDAHLTQDTEPTLSPQAVRHAAVSCIDDLLLRLTHLRASLGGTPASEPPDDEDLSD